MNANALKRAVLGGIVIIRLNFRGAWCEICVSRLRCSIFQIDAVVRQRIEVQGMSCKIRQEDDFCFFFIYWSSCLVFYLAWNME